MATMTGRLRDIETVRSFAYAGKATLTLKSVVSGNWFTYKIAQCKDTPELFFVSLLAGSDNEKDYQYVGTIRNGIFQRGKRSKIGLYAPSVRAFDWFWAHLSTGSRLPPTVECWHAGKCGRCGRKLTVPESIANGFGPECVQYMKPNLTVEQVLRHA